MKQAESGQVNASAAEIYEQFFIPALFGEWPPRVVEAARLEPGQRALDVACGTGVLARAVSDRVGPSGSVVGVDINDGMLAVAQRKAPEVEWRQAPAEALPFDDGTFDGVLSQFGLMFFEDRRAALEEMMRVLRPGGCLAVVVWDSLDNTPGYLAMTELLGELFGGDAADALRAPYQLGDAQTVRTLFADAGIPDVDIATLAGTARFPSVESWVFTDVKGWTLADMIDDSQFELLRAEAEIRMQRFVTDRGDVSFTAPAHIITASKV